MLFGNLSGLPQACVGAWLSACCEDQTQAMSAVEHGELEVGKVRQHDYV
jgi:hypothetical protein